MATITQYKRLIRVYRALSDLMKDLGFEAWLVGGLVRDLLLGLEPKDYDIVVNIPAISLLKEALEKKGLGGYIAGDDAEVKNNLKNEVLKFRIVVDGIPEDIDAVIPRVEEYDGISRKPKSVSYAGGLTVEETLDRDSRRRDFTINALYLKLGLNIEELFAKSFYTEKGTINKEHVSKFIDDPTGGLDLLKISINGKLETVLELTNDPRTVFGQDPLRMLRAIRFVATKGCILSKNLEKALYHNVDKFKVGTLISYKRIEQEISKILLKGTAESVTWAFEFMYKSRMLLTFLPELDKTWGFDQMNHHHDRDLWEHLFGVLEYVKKYPGSQSYGKMGLEPDVVSIFDVKKAKIDSYELCVFWAALLHDIAKPETQKFDEKKQEMVYHNHELESSKMAIKILEKLKYSSDFAFITAEIIKRHMLIKNFYSTITKNGTVEASRSTMKKLRDKFIINFHGFRVDIMGLCIPVMAGDDTAKAEPSLNNFNTFIANWFKFLDNEKSLPQRPRFKIDGQVVMARYGLKPGKELGEKIKKIKEFQITSDAANLEELLDEFDKKNS
jgi:poly(A) polymerase